MTSREYLAIACVEIGRELAEEGREFDRGYLGNYPQYHDAIAEFGRDNAEAKILRAYNRRREDLLAELDREIEECFEMGGVDE